MRIIGKRRTTTFAAAVVAFLLGLSAAPSAQARGSQTQGGHDRGLRINQLQVVGSHNSYHLEATPAESQLRASVDPIGQKALEYAHAPLGTQFAEQQVRQIELDIYADPEGARYSAPLVRTLTNGGPYDPVMDQPGTKVLHIQDIDYHSNCLTFRRCLKAVKSWSDANPRHVPVAVMVEFKDEPLPPGLPVTVPDPLPWTSDRMDTVDREIRSVFRADDLITPDSVRGKARTLERAVLKHGWPTLAEARGKVMFLMANDGAYRTNYLAGHPGLRGRVLFTNSTPGQPDAGFIKEDDPTGANLARIQSEVRAGYLVRTRADTETQQARTGDTTMRDAALASGAQWVSTDYPDPSLSQRFGTTYSVRLPDGVARCTPIAPVNAPATCARIRP
jgi:hypothetical protein